MKHPNPGIAASTSRSDNRASRRIIVLCGVIPVLIAGLLALYRPASLSRLDNATYDAVLRWAGTKPPDGRVVIVDVDERSLLTIGQWPWRRDLIGRLVAEIRKMGASAVALDMIFAEPDRDGQTNPDAVLAETLRKGGVVLGYGMTFDHAPAASGRCVLHPVGLALINAREETDESPFFQATDVICSLPMLANAARASGFLNAAPDADGVLRRAPLLMQLDGRVYPGLALAAVAAATNARDVALEVLNVNAASLIVDNVAVPLDGKSNLLLRYRGTKKTFPFISAADIMTGAAGTDVLHDKIVFVGTTALGTREVVVTPLDTLFTGVEVQATVADNLLQRDFIRRHELGTALEGLAALVLGTAIALLVAKTGLFWGAVGGVAALVLPWWAAVWSLSANGVFVSPLFATVGVIVGFAVMTTAKFGVERRRAERAGHDKTNAQRLMVQTLLSLTEARDAETGSHSRRTQQYTKLLAQQLAAHPMYREYLTAERIELLSSLAPLHDIGKVGIADSILHKPGPLQPDELAEMRRHPEYGRAVILNAERDVGVRDDAILAVAKDIVYTHHEKWDGTTTRTVYCQPLSHDHAVKFIVSGKGTHFDPAVVDAFVRVESLFNSVAHEGYR
jgi:CHASE2 domain-containing sensor protein